MHQRRYFHTFSSDTGEAADHHQVTSADFFFVTRTMGLAYKASMSALTPKINHFTTTLKNSCKRKHSKIMQHPPYAWCSFFFCNLEFSHCSGSLALFSRVLPCLYLKKKGGTVPPDYEMKLCMALQCERTLYLHNIVSKTTFQIDIFASLQSKVKCPHTSTSQGDVLNWLLLFLVQSDSCCTQRRYSHGLCTKSYLTHSLGIPN